MIVTILALFGFGCWPVEYANKQAPFAQATWTGTAETITLYDHGGKTHVAIALNIDSGPRMKYPDGKEYHPVKGTKPVLVNEKGLLLQPPLVTPGDKVEVSGWMATDAPAFLPDVGTLSTKPNGPKYAVYGIKVNGQPKKLP
jgi:hypothetical protein